MATETADEDTTLSPDDAFAVLGNETRMDILQTLAEAEDPIPFSELRERVGVSDSGQFNYHLDKLAGHFVDDSDDGYVLQRAGERIIEAVLSGAVTETPTIEPTRIDRPCPQCGAPVRLSYQQEWVALSCTECPGYYDGSIATEDSAPEEQLAHGYLGGLSLPPAAVKGRTASEVYRVADTWAALETLAGAEDICPRCSAPIEQAVDICDDHDTSDGPCEQCDSRWQVTLESTCTICPYTQVGSLLLHLSSNTDLIAFMSNRGFNPVRPIDVRQVLERNEEVLSTDPFKARMTYTLDEDSITLTVNDDLNVTAATTHPASEST